MEFTSWIVYTMKSTMGNQRKKMLISSIEYQLDSMKGIRTHHDLKNTLLSWTIQNPETPALLPYIFKRKVCKMQEINELQTLKIYRIFKVLNRDSSDYVTKNTWKPLFMKMGNCQTGFLTLNL